MASRSEGETCDERAVLTDAFCAQVAPQWRPLVRSALTARTWMPYLLVYRSPTDEGSYFLLACPSSSEVQRYKKAHKARVAVLNVFQHLKCYVDQSAAETAEWEDRWPMDDNGSADWLA